MANSDIRPPVIRCPHRVLCASQILCLAFNPAVKTEVQRAGLCPEARGERHARETVERFEEASVDIDTRFEVEGDENG